MKALKCFLFWHTIYSGSGRLDVKVYPISVISVTWLSFIGWLRLHGCKEKKTDNSWWLHNQVIYHCFCSGGLIKLTAASAQNIQVLKTFVNIIANIKLIITPPATIHDPGANSSFETLFAVWVQPFAMQICLFNSLWAGSWHLYHFIIGAHFQSGHLSSPFPTH